MKTGKGEDWVEKGSKKGESEGEKGSKVGKGENWVEKGWKKGKNEWEKGSKKGWENRTEAEKDGSNKENAGPLTHFPGGEGG